MIKDCTAVVLTGGESQRMGADKAMVLLDGKPLLEHVLENITPLFSQMLVSVHTLRPDLKYVQIVDDAEGRGPMVGIQCALEEAKTDWVFVIACDMPFVSTVLIQTLANKRESFAAVVPYVFDRPQPLFAFYSKTCLVNMQVRMKQGQRSMIRLLAELDTYILSEQQVKRIDPKLRSFISLDTVEDVNKMENKI
ncbi:MAG: molybdenum cofactor guanylyltransferase [Mariprofundaceae bacterium]|nr:molybdenum cofactor guanylyltransferase [Mariprofundaceae bacterium]